MAGLRAVVNGSQANSTCQPSEIIEKFDDRGAKRTANDDVVTYTRDFGKQEAAC
ncbi:Midasin [Corchorus olitorius]|uniref:Midasin n=1 Tax=Corchorus olitorius TaxID=93759 RepID=A0A1R3IXJ6_9ROSI|nr:Midasin [Corchorus olitorius]